MAAKTGISIDISGAAKRLKSDAIKIDKNMTKALHSTAGKGERKFKTICPVDFGFLKNATHSRRTGDMEYAIVNSQNYVWFANVRGRVSPPRGPRFIEKTTSYINGILPKTVQSEINRSKL